MDRVKVLEKYKNEEDKLLVAKLLDKVLLTERQNKIQTTDFLSPTEFVILEEVLHSIGLSNFVSYGASKNAQRKVIIIYPSKLEKVFEEEKFDYNSICSCIRIRGITEEYSHKIYLGGIIKLGVKREKVGDIVVLNDGADIIVSKEVTEFLVSNLSQLTRFKNANIDVVDLSNITKKQQEFMEMKIIVSSLRLDNVVAELSKTSRSKALEILKQERVFVNYKSEIKHTKNIKCEDIITIRGIGKFIIDEILGNTKSGRIVLIAKKFI